MIRRYNMRRSDNFPICATIEFLCVKSSGRFFVHTGFQVKSAIISPVTLPTGSEAEIDNSFEEKDGFYVIYRKVPEMSVVKFSYQAQ